MVVKFVLMAIVVVGVAQAHDGYHRDQPVNQLPYQQYGVPPQWQNSDQEVESTGDEIPGVAGRDYPIFREVPETSFDCERQEYPGYYADPAANCQAFHICRPQGRKDSFLCPNGTLFNQERLVCDWWTNVDCSQAEGFYRINEAVARAMIEADRILAQRKVSNNNANGNDYRYIPPSKSTQEHGNKIDLAVSTVRPIYGVPEISANNLPAVNGNGKGYQNVQYQHNPHASGVTGANFPKQHFIRQPKNIYLPA